MEEKDDFEILECNNEEIEEKNKENVEILYSYNMTLFEYENQIGKINENIEWNKTLYGFIIDLKDYEDLKKKIQYEKLKEYFNNEQLCKKKINEIINTMDIEGIKLKKIDRLEIKDSNQLVQFLQDKKEYKLINVELWKKICLKEKENKSPILYYIEFPEITLYLNKNDLITFFCKDNILNNELYITSGNNKVMNISKSIIEYYNLINKMKKNMTNKVHTKEKGYLVSKTWIDNWKNYVDFNSIKFNEENKNKIYEIEEQIFEIFKNTKKKRRLTVIETLNFKEPDDLEEYLKKDSLFIINESFYASVSIQNIEKKNIIDYSYSDEIITINLKKGSIQITSKDNNELMYINIMFEKLSKNKERRSSLFSWFKFKNGKRNKNDKCVNQDLEDFSIENYNIDNNEEKEENISLNKPQNIRDKFKLECPHIGLTNIGATCYMNATLQCMNHIEKFVNYFKYEYIDNKSDNLSSSFKILFDNLWPNDNNVQSFKDKYYAPEEFKNKISKMNPLFKGIAANDSKDLVNFIVMTLHKELNKPKKKEIENINKVIDQTNKEMVLECFLQEFTRNNNSIVKDLFYSVNCNITECSVCGHKIHNNQIYFFIIFPLEEVRKFKNENNIINNNNYNINNNCQNYCNFINYNYITYPNNNYINNNYYIDNNNYINNNTFNNNYYNFYNNNYNNNINNIINNNFNNINNNVNNNINNNNDNSQNNINNEVTIYDCFDYDKKINIMSGENSMYCNFCKGNTTASMYTNLVSGPKILILILNRGKGIEFDVKIKFYEEINLYKYIDKKDTGHKYKLLGVITHIGESSMSGHFIAYCRDFINNKWYKYNDAIVSEVNDFQSEVIDFAMPYLLFYQKIDI